jgi:hypothetical protein
LCLSHNLRIRRVGESTCREELSRRSRQARSDEGEIGASEQAIGLGVARTSTNDLRHHYWRYDDGNAVLIRDFEEAPDAPISPHRRQDGAGIEN